MPEKTDFSGKHGKIKGNRYVRGIMKTLNTQIILIILKFLTIPAKTAAEGSCYTAKGFSCTTKGYSHTA